MAIVDISVSGVSSFIYLEVAVCHGRIARKIAASRPTRRSQTEPSRYRTTTVSAPSTAIQTRPM